MEHVLIETIQGSDVLHAAWRTRQLQDEMAETFITYDDRVKFLQKILRGELSAIEAYDHVLRRNGKTLVFSELSRIRAEHEQSINRLKQFIMNKGEPPEQDSGLWGKFVKTLVAGSAMISDEALIKILREGEEHGLVEYRQFLEMSPTLSEEESIRLHFIPAQERHVQELKDIFQ